MLLLLLPSQCHAEAYNTKGLKENSSPSNLLAAMSVSCDKPFLLDNEEDGKLQSELPPSYSACSTDLVSSVLQYESTEPQIPSPPAESPCVHKDEAEDVLLTRFASPCTELNVSPDNFAKRDDLRCQSQGSTLRASLSSMSGGKARFHSVHKGTGIAKHMAGRGVGRAKKLANLDIAAEHVAGVSPHALLTSPRLLRSPGRKKSPIRWFPRKKTESYLERKIRMLQEKEGKVSSLDETLGAASLHLSRIEREKLAAQAAAAEAMNAKKDALIEASWCRILKLAGIPCRLAIVELQKAEKKASAALAEAESHGVILQHGHTERDLASDSVTAALDTAFEVDKEVTTAIKVALKHVSQATNDENVEACDSTADYSLEVFSTAVSQIDGENKRESNLEGHMSVHTKIYTENCYKGQHKAQHSLLNLLESRIMELSIDHRTSLAAIVATRGLSELLKDQSLDQLDDKTTVPLDSRPLDCGNPPKTASDLGSILVKHVSRLEREVQAAKESHRALQTEKGKRSGGRQQNEEQVEGLDQILVKHVSRLEKEKLAAQAAKREATAEGLKDFNHTSTSAKKACPTIENSEGENVGCRIVSEGGERKMLTEVTNTSLSLSTGTEATFAVTSKTPDMSSMLVFGKEKPAIQSNLSCDADQDEEPVWQLGFMEYKILEGFQEDKQVSTDGLPNEILPLDSGRKRNQKQVPNDIPDLSSVLVKRVSRLEKEQEALLMQDGNLSARKGEERKVLCVPGLGDILVKKLSKLEIEKASLSEAGVISSKNADDEKLDSCIKKDLSKGIVNREDDCFESRETENQEVGNIVTPFQRAKLLRLKEMESTWGGLSLQNTRFKSSSTGKENCSVIPTTESYLPRRKSLREKQMEDSWGGLDLGSALKRHVSKLEMEQASWKRAEEEARQRLPLQR